MEIDLFFVVFLAVLLANVLAGIIHSNMMHIFMRPRNRLKRNKVYKIPSLNESDIPPSNEVMESELDKQAEIMARAMKILHKQIRDKTGGEIDLDNPLDE